MANSTLIVRAAGTSYLGNPQFVVKVDGVQVGGPYSVSASYPAGQWQDFTIQGDFGANPSNVSVTFINDASGGTPDTDRNLFVQSVTLNGQTQAAGLGQLSGATFRLPDSVAAWSNGASVSLAFGRELKVWVSGDAWSGNPEFVATVDGVQIGGSVAVTASRASGAWQEVTLFGNFSRNPEQVAIRFVNDASGGAGNDRNLYVQKIAVDGRVYDADVATRPPASWLAGDSVAIWSNGSLVFDTQRDVVVRVAGDSWQGDAKFYISVDGVAQSAVYTATASRALGEWQDIALAGNFGSDLRNIAVHFINDAYGGSQSTDRNLWVDRLTLDGKVYEAETAATLSSNGSVLATSVGMLSNGSLSFKTERSLILRVSGEATGTGLPLFRVSVDGQTVGTLQTVTASRASGEWQDVTLSGNFGSNPGSISVDYLGGVGNDPGRRLYVDKLTLDGKIYEAEAAALSANGGVVGTAVEMAGPGSLSFNTNPSLTLRVSGETTGTRLPQFIASIDGQTVGGVQTVTASRANGEWQDVTISGNFGSNPGSVSIDHLGASWDGTGRKLYVDKLTLNGRTYEGETAVNYAGDATADSARLFRQESLTFDTDLSTSGPAVYAGQHSVAFTTGGYVSVGPKLQYESTQPWSAKSAVKIDAYPTDGTVGELIFGNANDAPYSGYEMYVNERGRLHVRIIGDFFKGNYLGVEGTTNLIDGRWHSVGATYDGSATAAGVKLYVDGVLQQTTVERDALTGSIVTATPKNMYVGNQVAGLADQFYFLHGKMDDFSLSDVVRPLEYFSPNSSLLGSIDGDTVLAYDFENGAGTTVTDRSSFGNNGTLTGGVSWV